MPGLAPSPPARAVGDKITASDYLNYLKGAVDRLRDPDRCSLYQTTGTAVLNTTWTVVTFDTEDYDTNSLHGTTNTSRITAAVDGTYSVNAFVVFPSNVTSTRLIQVRKNAAGAIGGGTLVAAATAHVVSSNQAPVSLSVDVKLLAGEYVELFAFHGAGATLTTISGLGNTAFQARWSAIYA